MTISAALITLNEEGNIRACLESVRWADEIVMVDSGSRDGTVELAKAYTSKVYTKQFTDFASQKNAALELATGDWIFFIDADERVPTELADEMRRIAADNAKDAAYAVHRKTYFFEKRLRFSGTQGDYPVRFFPRGAVRFEQLVHERIVTELPIKKMRAQLLHYTTRDIRHYKEKLNLYIRLENTLMASRERKATVADVVFRPIGVFVNLYLLKLGILDGLQGLQFAFLSAFYAFTKYKNHLKFSAK